MTVIGNAGGLAVQGLLVSVGLGAIIARSDTVYTALKLVGAAYLILLGVRKIRDRRDLAVAFAGGATVPRRLRTTIRRGSSSA